MPGVKQRLNCIAMLCVLNVVAGCGGGVTTYPVKGVVTIKGEGPLSVGQIIFTSNEITAKGAIQKDGSFTLTTTTDRELSGAPAGKYQVYILGAATYEDNTKLDSPSKILIDSKFNDYRTSGLKYTVEPDANMFEIVVTKPGTGPSPAAAPSQPAAPRATGT